MNKLLLAVIATSSVASTGCLGLIGMAIGAHQESKEAKRAETKSFNELDEKFGELDRKYAELPTDMEALEEANDDWMGLYSRIEGYQKNDYFGSKKIGSCLADADRKNSDHCKKAIALRGKVAQKVADTLHAGMDADPVVSTGFPLTDIVRSQGEPEIAALVDVEASLTKLVPKWNDYFARRVAKAGGADSFTRKQNHGVCFLSETAQGEDVDPRFALSRSSDELHVRCVAPQAIRSYDRTQQDAVDITLETGGSYSVDVDALPGDQTAETQTFDAELPMSHLRKAAKNAGERSGDDGDDVGAKKSWRFVLAQVQYNTFQKTGDRVESVGDQVRVSDSISHATLASGFAVIDMESDIFKAEVAVSDASDDADEEAAPKPKKHKSSKKHGKHRKHKKS